MRLSPPVLLIHGGAGALDRDLIDTDEVHAALRDALGAGAKILRAGGRALDAAVAAVVTLEDCGRFNAGRGSVRASDGSVTLDASVMDGRTRAAGAVAAATGLKNAVLAARLVLERSPHVLLAGPGADAFAAAEGLPRVAPDYFVPTPAGRAPRSPPPDRPHGTVGAVALDATGSLAAATSTGGTTGKLPGRVGDSPLIGAGTYADERCAISATGTGETFVRAVFGYRIRAALDRGNSLEAAALAALGEVTSLGGSGGCIALDAEGNATFPFTTRGMFRGHVDASDRAEVAIF